MSRVKRAMVGGIACVVLGALFRVNAQAWLNDLYGNYSFFDDFKYRAFMEAGAALAGFGSAIILVATGIWVARDPADQQVPNNSVD